jgi:hypothetical protein
MPTSSGIETTNSDEQFAPGRRRFPKIGASLVMKIHKSVARAQESEDKGFSGLNNGSAKSMRGKSATWRQENATLFR